MIGNEKKKRSKFKLLLSVLAFLMTPYGYAGELTMRSKNISPIYAGSLCLVCGIMMLISWYKNK